MISIRMDKDYIYLETDLNGPQSEEEQAILKLLSKHLKGCDGSVSFYCTEIKFPLSRVKVKP